MEEKKRRIKGYFLYLIKIDCRIKSRRRGRGRGGDLEDHSSPALRLPDEKKEKEKEFN